MTKKIIAENCKTVTHDLTNQNSRWCSLIELFKQLLLYSYILHYGFHDQITWSNISDRILRHIDSRHCPSGELISCLQVIACTIQCYSERHWSAILTAVWMVVSYGGNFGKWSWIRQSFPLYGTSSKIWARFFWKLMSRLMNNSYIATVKSS